jgi:hypothetical protein
MLKMPDYHGRKLRACLASASEALELLSSNLRFRRLASAIRSISSPRISFMSQLYLSAGIPEFKW